MPRNQLSVAVSLRKPAWFPRITIKFGIERQPHLPDEPVLVIRLLSYGSLAAFAGPAARLFSGFPPWVQMAGETLRLDLAELLQQYDAVDALSYVERLEITTRKGSVVLAIDARVS